MSNKSNLRNLITLEQLLEFEEVFPNEQSLTVEKYLLGGSRDVILNVAAFFLGFNNQNSIYEDNYKFIEMYFRKENNEVANKVYNQIKSSENNGIKVRIVNSYSSLKLFETFFSMPEKSQEQTQSEFEVNLFKAYLVLNSEYSQKQLNAFPSTQKSDEKIKIPMILFCMFYPTYDKVNYDIRDIWVTQIIKSVYLFQFLEDNERTRPLLTAFLAHFKSSTWQDYLKNIIPLTIAAIEPKKEAHIDIVIKQDEKYFHNCSFIEKLIVQMMDELDPNDFITLRAKPFYKINNGVYRIIFNLFVVEKIFKGVYFLLRDINKTLPTTYRIKEIKSFYGDEFSEKILCYKVMEIIYPRKCIRFSGKDLADKKIDAAPDYYLRNGENILLIESKDFLIAADKKMSFDYKIYEQEFMKILNYELLPSGRKKPKAISQLINNIRRILKKEFYADTRYHYKDVSIHPILLTHDHQYDTPGFNELLDFWFQEALNELEDEGLFIHKVKPISVVNIDTLLFHQVGLSKHITLHEMLNLYQQNKFLPKQKNKNFYSKEEQERYINEYSDILLSKHVPFSIFIEKYFQKHGLWEKPPLIEIVNQTLF